MEKDKMIYDVANMICENETQCNSCLKCTIYDGKICCKYLRVAGKIVDTIIPEGSVVLTKKEYAKYKEHWHKEYREGFDFAEKKTAREIYIDYEKEIKTMYVAFDSVDAFSILELLKEVCEKHGADFDDGVEVEE